MKKKRLNKHLHSAKKVKNDEFYTQRKDIENELGLYPKNYFKDKVIFCNCDDPLWSNFYFYFSQNFDFLGLKKLITTSYKEKKSSYKIVIERDKNGKIKKPIKTNLKENGDFRSQECIELLKESDIVVTNPPFSLFREYVAQLIEYKKKFIIIGNQNAITYKEIFKLIKDNKIWLGNTYPKEFLQPDDSIKKFGNISWFTNLEIKKRHEDLILYKKYNPKDYPNYDNYKAINVDKVSGIPIDYGGVMGVPITFMDKFNPDQFEIIGQTHSGDKSPEVESLRKDPNHRHRGIVHGENKEKYARILIKNKKI